MQIFGLKTCDTCKKARKTLPNAEFLDVRDDGVPEAVLDAALETFGADLLNTRSTTWRGLSEADRSGAPKDLLVAHPTLMKRPLILSEGEMFLGWKADVQNKLLGSSQ